MRQGQLIHIRDRANGYALLLNHALDLLGIPGPHLPCTLLINVRGNNQADNLSIRVE